MFNRVLQQLLLIVGSASVALAANSKLELIGAFSDESAPESLRSVLEAKGQRVVLGDGSTLCDIWWRNGVPTRPKQELKGANYSELDESTFVGVVSFPKGNTDYRGQTIKPGAYLMRYALLPSDGNHMGAAPSRDFLLLTPMGTDREANARFKFEDLVNLSRKASGTGHPSPLSLLPATGQKKIPALVEDEHGFLVLTSTVKTSAGTDLPLALVVKGHAEQ